MGWNDSQADSERGALLATRAVARFGGSARYSELIAAGATDFSLRCALQQGVVVRPHRGTYVIPGIASAQVLSEIFRATVTCISRCGAIGLPLLRDDHPTHLLVPRSRSVSRASGRPVSDVELHRRDDFTAEYATSVIGAIDVAGLCLPAREQLALVDAAVHGKLIRQAALDHMHISSPERRAFLAKYADGRAESMSETFARIGLVEAGIRVEPQRSLIANTRTDLVVEGLIALEVDSRKHHAEWSSQRADRDRDRRLSILGYVPMRITFEDAAYSVDEVVADVKAVLWRHGLRGDLIGR